MGAMDYADRRVSPYQQMRDVYREVLSEAALDAPEIVLPRWSPCPRRSPFSSDAFAT